MGFLRVDLLLLMFEHFLWFLTNIDVTWLNILWIAFLGVLVHRIYWIYFIPMDWTRSLTDVGYKYHVKGMKSSTQKLSTIDRMRKLRKLGTKLPPPFPNGWFALAETHSLKSGEAIDVACLGQRFVVFRSEDNEAFVLDAYCSHLGANLGIGGTVRGNCIECPFHQWSFSGTDGKCKKIPYSGTIPNSAKVKKHISKEVNGTIFVWYHSENETPWEIPIVHEIANNAWVYQGRNEFIVNCHVQEVPENGADVAHLSAVHGFSMLSGGALGRAASRRFWCIGSHAWEALWKPCTQDNEVHMAAIKLQHSIKVGNFLEFCTINVKATQVGPAYVMLYMTTSLGPFVVLQTVTPLEPFMQKIVHQFYGPRYASFIIKFIFVGECIMFERDISVWNHKTYVDSPCLVKEDRAVKVFRNWFSQFYSANSKQFAHAMENNIDW